MADVPEVPVPASHPRGRGVSRRAIVVGVGAVALAAAGGATLKFRKRIWRKVDQLTALSSFTATPALLAHDPVRDKATIHVAQGGGPGANIDGVLGKLGGIATVVGTDDVVVIKVSAQWWNQGMTNVAAVRRTLEHILERPGFKGDVVVMENTHFRLADGSGLSRGWVRPSVRNVDVPGWDKLGDLIGHFQRLGAPISFVGLVDAGLSELSGEHWHDPDRLGGIYGGDGRGPIAAGEDRDGYFWDFDKVFRVKRSWIGHAQTPLTWPRFTCPRTGLVVDLKRGVFRRENGALAPVARKLTFINMTTGNEHGSTGFTGAVKSPMGLVDMSAGAKGSDPRVADYQSIHYFGSPRATWRMAGPLAYWCQQVRKPDLYLTCVEWMAVTPRQGYDPAAEDMRHAASCAVRAGTVVAGVDPVAIDAWCVRHLLMPAGGANAAMYDLDNPDSKISKFLRYYREVAGAGTIDPGLVTVT